MSGALSAHCEAKIQSAIAQACETLVASVPAPHIHLLIAEDLTINDPTRAHTVLRCVQEIITNAIRHAAAGNLWIELARTDSGVRDNAPETTVAAQRTFSRDMD